jgi:nitroimidazol reductase NimA-like FMN-containing flavoprotein (pyridoxamine 5'-phosphate oxidase superfamily)
MGKYHMRRLDRQIDDKEISDILEKGRYAVIAMCSGDEPYIVTLSYGYDTKQNVLYMHTGTKGQKVDILKQNPNVCATVIDDLGYLMDECGHRYRSVVMEGKITFVDQLEEKISGMEVILNHLEENPSIVRERSLKSPEIYSGISILRLDIVSVTGKKGR